MKSLPARSWSAPRHAAVVCVLLAASAGTAACATSASSPPSESGSKTLVIGISGDPATLDPAQGADSVSNEILKNTYLQWTRYDTQSGGDGYRIADPAKVFGEAASYTFSSDQLTATFTIPAGEKFPSGNPVTAEDFAYTVKRALSTNLGPVFIFKTAGIDSPTQVKTLDDQRFTITLSHPSPLFGPLLRDQDASVLDSVSVAKHATTSDPWALDWMAKNSVGGGAYTLTKYDAGNQITLEKNPNYPDSKSVYFDKVILRIIPSESQRAQLLANGTLDIAEGLSLMSISDLEQNSSIKILDIPGRAQDMMGLVQTAQPFSDAGVREAIAHAIDYDSLAEDVQKGYAKPPKGVWPQNSASFDSAVSNSPFTYDPTKAKSLLAAAGHASGLSFTLEVSTGDASGQALAVAVQSQLKAVGINMAIAQVAPATFSQHLADKSTQAFISTGLSNYVDDPYYGLFLFYAHDAYLNWFGLGDSTIDSITAKLATETDVTARQSLASQAQTQLNTDIPSIILDEPDYTLAMRSDISGFVLEPDGLVRYSYLGRSN